MSRASVNKLLHRPFDVLRKMAEDEAGDDPLPIVQRMFGVELDGEGGDPGKGDRG